MSILSFFKKNKTGEKGEEQSSSFSSSPLILSSCSIQGRKAKQEDNFLIWQDDRDVVVLVADGVGGHGHGDFASDMTCHKIFGPMLNLRGVGDDPVSFLKDTCYQAAQEVFNKGIMDPSFKNCGTTLTGFVYRKGEGYWTINVGDSRVYLVNPKERCIRQLTEDQTSDSSTRVMKYAIGQSPDYMRPHIDVYKWGDEDYDVLCPGMSLMAVSDGVCEPFEIPSPANPAIYTDNEIFNEFMYNLKYDEKAAEKVVEHSFMSGSKDNITCVIMTIGEL